MKFRSVRKNQKKKASLKCQGKCWYCGETPEKLTVDHATPRSRGGKNTETNLLPACKTCNGEKASANIAEYRKYCKVKVIRKLMSLGFFSGDMSKIKIRFYGEGNTSPFLIF